MPSIERLYAGEIGYLTVARSAPWAKYPTVDAQWPLQGWQSAVRFPREYPSCAPSKAWVRSSSATLCARHASLMGGWLTAFQPRQRQCRALRRLCQRRRRGAGRHGQRWPCSPVMLSRVPVNPMRCMWFNASQWSSGMRDGETEGAQVVGDCRCTKYMRGTLDSAGHQIDQCYRDSASTMLKLVASFSAARPGR